MRVLVINAGSSSIKYRLFEMSDERSLASGLLERIGSTQAKFKHRTESGSASQASRCEVRHVADHRAAMRWIVEALTRDGLLTSNGPGIDAIGHRVVHGGERFTQPARIDTSVIQAIDAMASLAPLHNPANLLGIRVAAELVPEAAQVAVFDTAFHQTLPACAYRYALPERLYRDFGIRRYGFHGTSHQFLAETASTWLGRPLETLRLITLHLGNGASAAAIDRGRCIDTSMGVTPLEGLVMGTRSGDIDPAIPYYLVRQGWHWDETETLLNQDSGLKGMTGSADLREIEVRATQGDTDARFAIELMSYRLRKYIGAYLAVLGGLDALIFSGGIGEHSALVRASAVEGLGHLGLEIDHARNSAATAPEICAIEAPGSAIALLVIPTDEELAIARQTRDLLLKQLNAHTRPPTQPE